MLALIKREEFAGIVGTETKTKVDGKTVCIGDIVKVDGLAGSGYNATQGVVGIFTDKISIMGLGSIPLSELNITEIVKSHVDLKAGSELHNGYFEVREFEM